MKTTTIVLIVVAVALLATGAYFFSGYGSYSDAQAACVSASEGRPAGQALSHLREVARKRGTKVVEAGEWSTATFRSTVGAGYACGIRIRDGKLTEHRVARAGELEANKK
jgi:hypothetical protein